MNRVPRISPAFLREFVLTLNDFPLCEESSPDINSTIALIANQMPKSQRARGDCMFAPALT